MKSTLLLLLPALLLLGSPALAQNSPAEVTLSQITFYQNGMEMGCKDAGRRKGEPAAKVDALCDCILRTLKAEVKDDEWRQAYFSSVKGREQDEAKILNPHMANARSCRSGNP